MGGYVQATQSPDVREACQNRNAKPPSQLLKHRAFTDGYHAPNGNSVGHMWSATQLFQFMAIHSIFACSVALEQVIM